MSQENLSEIIRWKIKRTMMEFVSILFLFAGFFATLIAALNMAFIQENFLFLSFSGYIDDDNGCWIPFVLVTNHKVTNMI